MGGDDEVKLHGMWLSPYYWRVVWALKLKGIPYQFIEEDIHNKGPLLLQYNPVHKKIPILVHGENPICESMVILQYIEETWPNEPLLPSDPYERAVARFWLKFADEKIPMLWKIAKSSGEEREQATKDSLEIFQMLEERGLSEKKFFGGDEIGLVDVAFGAIAHWFVALQSTLELSIIEAHKFPRLHAWIENFKEVPLIKEHLPDLRPLLNK